MKTRLAVYLALAAAAVAILSGCTLAGYAWGAAYDTKGEHYAKHPEKPAYYTIPPH